MVHQMADRCIPVRSGASSSKPRPSDRRRAARTAAPERSRCGGVIMRAELPDVVRDEVHVEVGHAFPQSRSFRQAGGGPHGPQAAGRGAPRRSTSLSGRGEAVRCAPLTVAKQGRGRRSGCWAPAPRYRLPAESQPWIHRFAHPAPAPRRRTRDSPAAARVLRSVRALRGKANSCIARVRFVPRPRRRGAASRCSGNV